MWKMFHGSAGGEERRRSETLVSTDVTSSAGQAIPRRGLSLPSLFQEGNQGVGLFRERGMTTQAGLVIIPRQGRHIEQLPHESRTPSPSMQTLLPIRVLCSMTLSAGIRIEVSLDRGKFGGSGSLRRQGPRPVTSQETRDGILVFGRKGHPTNTHLEQDNNPQHSG